MGQERVQQHWCLFGGWSKRDKSGEHLHPRKVMRRRTQREGTTTFDESDLTDYTLPDVHCRHSILTIIYSLILIFYLFCIFSNYICVYLTFSDDNLDNPTTNLNTSNLLQFEPEQRTVQHEIRNISPTPIRWLFDDDKRWYGSKEIFKDWKLPDRWNYSKRLYANTLTILAIVLAIFRLPHSRKGEETKGRGEKVDHLQSKMREWCDSRDAYFGIKEGKTRKETVIRNSQPDWRKYNKERDSLPFTHTVKGIRTPDQVGGPKRTTSEREEINTGSVCIARESVSIVKLSQHPQTCYLLCVSWNVFLKERKKWLSERQVYHTNRNSLSHKLLPPQNPAISLVNASLVMISNLRCNHAHKCGGKEWLGRQWQ